MYRITLLSSCCCLIGLMPSAALAAVSISEIAWMGDTDSANYEWIELHNDGGSAVDINGWQLQDDNSLTIDLVGTIPAGAHVVLERNRSSEDYLNTPPFLVYTGALVNTGATLTLYQADGSLVDQVAGGGDWANIGGDNTTKETPQYTTSGWITALPTPGAPAPGSGSNATNESTSATNPTTTASTNSRSNTESVSTERSGSSGSSQSATPLVLSPSALTLTIDAPTTAYVGQPIELSVTAQGVVDVVNNSLRYWWNLGTAEQATSSQITHTYDFPGEYVVTVSGTYTRHSATARHVVTVLPVPVSLTWSTTGDIHVHNDAPYEVDVSGYRVVGDRRVVFPPHSAIVPQGTVTIAQARLTDDTSTPVALYDRQGDLVTHTALPQISLQSMRSEQDSQLALTTATTPSPVAPRTVPTPAPPANFTFATASPVASTLATSPITLSSSTQPTIDTVSPTASATVTSSPLAASTGGQSVAAWWTSGGLILLLVATISGLWWQRRLTQVG